MQTFTQDNVPNKEGLNQAIAKLREEWLRALLAKHNFTDAATYSGYNRSTIYRMIREAGWQVHSDGQTVVIRTPEPEAPKLTPQQQERFERIKRKGYNEQQAREMAMR